ncbi:hypothetical protein [Helicobacter bizzozeronii]|uniref:hypothetical protein n=1 Tax=Helicobacter bizzozeronii TaxID=56877 RepID=UPI000CF06D17|nr:hypothetical protein [Helicobacter bizzozeronii]
MRRNQILEDLQNALEVAMGFSLDKLKENAQGIAQQSLKGQMPNIKDAQALLKPLAKVIVDDILALQVENAPFVILRTTDTHIHSTLDAWRHTMEIECEILAKTKAQADTLLEIILHALEVFGGVAKKVKGLKVQKVEVASTPLYSLLIELEMMFSTPSFKA